MNIQAYMNGDSFDPRIQDEEVKTQASEVEDHIDDKDAPKKKGRGALSEE